MSEPYDIGDGVEIALTFKDRDGALRDPLVGSLLLVDPDGAESEVDTADMVHASTGKFTYDLVFTKAGTWRVRGRCSDEVAAVVKEKEYFVRKQRF